nr:putative ribonuclease H-like domain-containing protein [Tanacetum cinerariifolium]
EPEFDEKKPESKVNVSPSSSASQRSKMTRPRERLKARVMNKKDERGIMVRNIARLVAQGHTQEEGIDYEEVFALVTRIEAISIFLAYASFMGFMVFQMDVKSAFLYGTIEEEVYVCQPLGFKEPDHPDKMSSMGEVTFFLGLQVKQKKDGIFISQDKYVAEILRKFGLIERKLASTPIDTENPLLKDPDGEVVDVHTYRSMIGSLMYLTSSRPDITFAVCACAHFKVTPKASHLHVVKRIFRYPKGKPHSGLWYLKDSPFDLVAYSDSDYVGASLDRKSTTRGCQFLGCRLTSCQYKKQIVVATSSTEAKYVAAASYYAQVLWIQNQLMDYGYNFMHTIIYIDNSSTKVFANIRRVGKGFSGVETPLFEGMLVEQQVVKEGDADENDEIVNAGDVAEGDVTAAHGEVPTAAEEPSIPSPTPPTPPPQLSQNIVSTSQEAKNVAADVKDDQDADVQVNANIQGRTAESQEKIFKIDLEHANKVLSLQEEKSEPPELQEVVDIVTTTMIITEVVTAASITITTAEVPISIATTAAAPSRMTKGVVIRDLEESTTTTSIIIHSEAKSKDKGKGILAEMNKNIDWDEVIDHVNKKAKVDPAVKRALKRINETLEEKVAKRQKLDEEVEELTRHLQIVPNEEDDVYTEATPLVHKVPVVDYEIIN